MLCTSLADLTCNGCKIANKLSMLSVMMSEFYFSWIFQIQIRRLQIF